MKRTIRQTEAPLSVHLASLGCAKNQVDSERILARLAAAGALVGAPADDAEIIIVNTCGFIESAKEESVEVILEMARQKEKGRCRKLIVMGCLAQRYMDSLRNQLPEVDHVVGLWDEKAILKACGLATPAGDPGRLLLSPPHTAYLRISDGCNNCCAYCAIPMIRGKFRSLPAAKLMREANRLVDGGARELVVIGQDTTQYGTDFRRGPRIHELLSDLSRIRKLRWLRLLYTHPAHFKSALIDAYADLPNLVPYVDLPLQHLNDEILRRMGRKTTQAQILKLIDRLRAKVSGVAIRTALIVGFPGETRAQFNEMLRLVKEIEFDQLGVFEYSREEGTRAVKMPGQVSQAVKAARRDAIMLAQREIVRRKNRKMKGQVMNVVVEKKAPMGEDLWIARSPVQAPDVDSVTYVAGEACKPGEFFKVRVTGSKGYDLLAEPVVE